MPARLVFFLVVCRPLHRWCCGEYDVKDGVDRNDYCGDHRRSETVKMSPHLALRIKYSRLSYCDGNQKQHESTRGNYYVFT